MTPLQRISACSTFLILLGVGLGLPWVHAAEEIALVKEGGVYKLPVKINGVLTLQFILDTGAADIQIPADVARTLLRTGTMQAADFLPGSTYRLADGTTVQSPRFMLRSVQIGTRVLTQVPASIGNLDSALLLGQSVLEKVGTWSMDSQRRVLALGPLRGREGPRATPDTTVTTAANSHPRPAPLAVPSRQAAQGTASASPSLVDAHTVERPAIHLGDTYVLESLYPDTPALHNTTARTVVAVDPGTITMTSTNIRSKTGKGRTLVFTPEWNLRSSRNADGSGYDYTPQLPYFAFPLYPGKTWQQTSRETSVKTGAVREHTCTATVGEWEEVSVAAGTCQALTMTTHTVFVDLATGQHSTGTDLSWYAPSVRRSVQSVITSQTVHGPHERPCIQLLQYELHERSACAVCQGSRERPGRRSGDGATLSLPIPHHASHHTAVSLDPSRNVDWPQPCGAPMASHPAEAPRGASAGDRPPSTIMIAPRSAHASLLS
jgi:hypothetical protein